MGTDKKLHVLYIIDLLDSCFGGTEYALLRLVRALPKDRFRCSVATFAVEGCDEVRARFPCPVHVFPLKRFFSLHALKLARQLRKLIRAEGVTIVHTFFPTA